MSVNVTKKNGALEPFSNDKIRKAILFAAEDLEVNPLALESKFDEFLFEGITTKKIQENLINHAKSLANATEPDWTKVAGRLLTMNIWSDVKKRKSYESYSDYVYDQQKNDIWKHPALNKYTKEELDQAGQWIVQERDLDHSYASVITAKYKYLDKNETIQDMHMGNALIIASIEKPKNRMKFVKKFYDRLSKRQISLATPWLSNLRANKNISSCFILQPEDDLISIFDAIKDAALISKNAGGLGISLSRCRATASTLMGVEGAATGVFGWNKLFNDVSVYVNQAGKRPGAFTVELDVWHRDIEEFLDTQTEAGDQRKKAYDVKLQVGTRNIFMTLAEDSANDWYTFCPHEVKEKLGLSLCDLFNEEFETAYYACVKAAQSGILKVVNVINAKALMIKIMKRMFEVGLPYLSHLDTINKYNPNPHIGNVCCVNLCTESFSVVVPDKLHHTCNLASIVAGRVELDDVIEVARDCTRILDNGIELTVPPVPESKAHNELLRTIGVGVQGYHDVLAREFKSFLDGDFAGYYAELIQYGCIQESIQLAKERGAYPAFKGSRWDDGFLTSEYAKKSKSRNINWHEVQKDINQYGIRNSQMTSPAPNTTTSIFMDAAAGVMPVYGDFFYEDNKNGIMPVAAMYIKENPLSYRRNYGTYKPYDIPPIIGRMQDFFDTGISAEYIMNKNDPDLTAKTLWDTIYTGWRHGNKAVYYIRTIKKGESLTKGDDVCASCSG